MSKYSEILNFDVESLNSLGDAYFGYAGSLIEKEDPKYYSYIASCYTVSAVLKSLIEPSNGSKAFQKAAEYYQLAENDYWIICSICAFDTERLLQMNLDFESKEYTVSFEEYLASTFINGGLFQEFPFINHSTPIGRLSIPFKNYLDALNELNDNRTFHNIHSFLRRSAETTSALMEDSYHWQTLLGNFVPVEPETLAFCITLCKKLDDVNGTVNGLLRQSELTSIEKLPLQIAEEIYKNRNRTR